MYVITIKKIKSSFRKPYWVYIGAKANGSPHITEDFSNSAEFMSLESAETYFDICRPEISNIINKEMYDISSLSIKKVVFKPVKLLEI